MTRTVNDIPAFALAGAVSTSSSGYGNEGARVHSTSSPGLILAASPPTCSDLWLIFRYQDPLPLATLEPTPQSASPKSKLSLISSGRSAGIVLAPLASKPIAVVPCSCASSPLPPEPGPKQVALGLVLTEVSAIATGFSASTLPPLPTTRSSADGAFAAAIAVKANVRDRASVQTAASRNGMILGI